jgi:opacity protein-like surface antigen
MVRQRQPSKLRTVSFDGSQSSAVRRTLMKSGVRGSGKRFSPPNLSGSSNAFDFLIGGGIDIPVTEKITIRPAQFEYLLTRFGNDFTKGNNNQSNFRYQAGVQFRF